MAFRFQRWVNIAPWLRMNISQSGLPDMGLSSRQPLRWVASCWIVQVTTDCYGSILLKKSVSERAAFW